MFQVPMKLEHLQKPSRILIRDVFGEGQSSVYLGEGKFKQSSTGDLGGTF